MTTPEARAKGGRVTAERLAHRIPYQGRLWTFRELEAETGVPYNRIRHRFRRGLRGADLFATEKVATEDRKIIVGMDVLPPEFKRYICGRPSL